MRWVAMILIGWIIFTAAVSYALILLGVSSTWVAIVALGMVGLGIMKAASKGNRTGPHY